MRKKTRSCEEAEEVNGLVVSACRRRIAFAACLFLFEKTVYFIGQHKQFSGVLLNGCLRAELHPAFRFVAVHFFWSALQKHSDENLSPGTPPGTLVQKLPVVVLSCSDFDELQSQLGGFSLEMDDLLFAVLGLIELGSLVYIFHSVAQHAVDEPSEFGSHGLGRHRRPQPSPKSAELRP